MPNDRPPSRQSEPGRPIIPNLPSHGAPWIWNFPQLKDGVFPYFYGHNIVPQFYLRPGELQWREYRFTVGILGAVIEGGIDEYPPFSCYIHLLEAESLKQIYKYKYDAHDSFKVLLPEGQYLLRVLSDYDAHHYPDGYRYYNLRLYGYPNVSDERLGSTREAPEVLGALLPSKHVGITDALYLRYERQPPHYRLGSNPIVDHSHKFLKFGTDRPGELSVRMSYIPRDRRGALVAEFRNTFGFGPPKFSPGIGDWNTFHVPAGEWLADVWFEKFVSGGDQEFYEPFNLDIEWKPSA